MKSEKIKCWILKENSNMELVEGKRIGKYILADNRFYFDSEYEINSCEHEFDKLAKETEHNLICMKIILITYGICVLIFVFTLMLIISK